MKLSRQTTRRNTRQTENIAALKNAYVPRKTGQRNQTWGGARTEVEENEAAEMLTTSSERTVTPEGAIKARVAAESAGAH
jgi:hypothetical protein